MKKELLRLLPVAAVLLTASCTDKQYDLSDIDTTSRFTAKGLVIPLNMEPIKLDAIISIEDDSDIKKDANGNYYFQKQSTTAFRSKDVKVEKITIAKPADISEEVMVSITLPQDIINKIEQYASNKTIAEIIGDADLSSLVGINSNTPIFKIEINDKKDFNLNAANIDSRITKLEKLGFEPLNLNIDIKLDGLKNLVSSVNIKDLVISLPAGMTVTNNDNYDTNTGKLTYDELAITEGQKNIQATVTGLVYDKMATDGAVFDADKHTFDYNKQCSVSGTAEIKAGNLNQNVKLATIVSATDASYSCDVKFSNNIVVNSFSGGINYTIEDINIDPVRISNLPEILQESGTNIELENPQLYLNVNNPFYDNNITATAGLRIEGNVPVPTDETGKALTFDTKNNKIALAPKNEDLLADLIAQGYQYEPFAEMKSLLSGDNANPEKDKVPEILNIKIVNPVLNADNVKDFALGVNHPGITGNWKFYTKLSLTENTVIKYTKTWDNWGSKDLDGLTVENAIVNFTVQKEVAMNADKIKFTLLGKTGELKGETFLQGDEEQDITIVMTNAQVKSIYGGKIDVTLKGQGRELNKEQELKISNLRVIVDGYYDKEF